MNDALSRQVGGNHYKFYPIQPAEYCHANGIEKLEGDVIAYVTRWRRKNGIEDLRKAMHTLELLIELEERERQESDQQTGDANAAIEVTPEEEEYCDAKVREAQEDRLRID